MTLRFVFQVSIKIVLPSLLWLLLIFSFATMIDRANLSAEMNVFCSRKREALEIIFGFLNV
tara:strand:+ start:833 stop:1015 length:183 start_codon:yes stop_codon:yes gene_type:complete